MALVIVHLIVQGRHYEACIDLASRFRSLAKIVQTSAKKACFQFAECSLSICKDSNNTRNLRLLTFTFLLILPLNGCETSANHPLFFLPFHPLPFQNNTSGG